MRVKLQSPFYCFWHAECQLQFPRFSVPLFFSSYSVLFFFELPFPMARDHHALVILLVFSPSPIAGRGDIHSSFRSPNRIFPPKIFGYALPYRNRLKSTGEKEKEPSKHPPPDGPLPAALFPPPLSSGFLCAFSLLPAPMQPPSHSLASVPAPQKPPWRWTHWRHLDLLCPLVFMALFTICFPPVPGSSSPVSSAGFHTLSAP